MNTPLPNRHPELVSGPIPPWARSKRRQTQPHRQIRPMRVALIDQIDLPLPMPALQLLLAQNRRLHLAEQFEMDEAMDRVARGEPGKRIIAMLPHSRDEVGRHADIQSPVMPARKDIGARLTLFPHDPECGAKWALKQVQGDEEGMGLEVSCHAELVSAPIVPQDAQLAGTSCCYLDRG